MKRKLKESIQEEDKINAQRKNRQRQVLLL